MPDLTKAFNRALFLVCVLVTGAVAGAFVWLFFYLMNIGITFLWQTVPGWLGSITADVFPILSQGPFGFIPYPLLVCVLGGLIIGLYAKRVKVQPEELNEVMAKVKETGRYDYSHVGKLSVAALLPLLFGGSIGPEAGLTGVIAGLCTWVGDRMRRFGADFRALTVAGTQAALTAVFTAPLYGFVAPLSGSADGSGGEEITFPKAQKAVVYLCAIVGAFGAFLILGQLFGGGGGLPRFDSVEVGGFELALLVPLALAGTACGWVFHAANKGTGILSSKMGNRPVLKAILAGLVLALCGMALPYSLFAGESQMHVLMERYAAVPAIALIATGFVKCALTPACINFGWCGGHFFPVIFSGVSLGFGFALLTGGQPVFCVAACTAALMGTVMRQPVMAALLLLMCFPPKGIAVMLVAALIGSAIPLPKALAPEKGSSVESKS